MLPEAKEESEKGGHALMIFIVEMDTVHNKPPVFRLPSSVFNKKFPPPLRDEGVLRGTTLVVY